MRKGDPFLFIRALEVSLVSIKSSNNVKDIYIYSYKFLNLAYGNDSTFLFKNKKSVIETFKILGEFSFFSGLMPTKEKCEKAGIGVKKVVKVALCGMKNIDLKKKNNKN